MLWYLPTQWKTWSSRQAKQNYRNLSFYHEHFWLDSPFLSRLWVVYVSLKGAAKCRPHGRTCLPGSESVPRWKPWCGTVQLDSRCFNWHSGCMSINWQLGCTLKHNPCKAHNGHTDIHLAHVIYFEEFEQFSAVFAGMLQDKNDGKSFLPNCEQIPNLC